MYEKVFNNIKSIILSLVLLVLLLWAIISNVRLYSTTKRLRQSEQRLESVRVELESTQNREREIAEVTERTSDLLAQAGTSVTEIRKKINILEESG